MKYVITLIFLTLCTSVYAVSSTDILPASTNEIKYADGTTARKGTIAATMANVNEFNKFARSPNYTETVNGLKKIENDQTELISSLYNLGVFKMFTPLEWMQDANDEGKIFVVSLYLQKYPQFITPKVYSRLNEIAENPSPALQPFVENTIKAYKKYSKSHPI